MRIRSLEPVAVTGEATVTEDAAATGVITEDPTVEHVCARPSWSCRACGEPWPCVPARISLAGGADRVMLTIYMWSHLDSAMPELAPQSPAELFDRFLSWTEGELAQA